MTAKGFCTCKRDFPQRTDFHPPAGATWHYLCDKPTNPADWPPEPWTREDQAAEDAKHGTCGGGY